MSGDEPRRPWGEAPDTPSSPPPPPAYGPPPVAGAALGSGSGTPLGSAAPGSASAKATASLVLGICGIVVVPVICSILAIVFGIQARNEIDASGGAIGGRGLAQAGIVLGWVGLALVVVGIVLVIVVFSALSFGGSEASTVLLTPAR